MHSFSDNNQAAKRPVAMTRTSSQQSAHRASPGGTITKSKQHRVSIGKAHARTPSYGKNLHKLTKIISDNPEDSSTGKKPVSPTSPHAAASIRRNISAGNLVRHAAKAPVRKNKSEVSLLRHHHHQPTHHHRSRPTTPTQKNESQTKDTGKAKHPKHKAKFEVDDNEDDGDWTEDSTSPVLTRQSSVSKGSRAQSRLGSSPPIQEPVMEADGSEDVSPGSPPDMQFDMLNLRDNARVQLLDRRQSRDAAAHPDVLAAQLLSGNTLTENTSAMHSRHGLVIPTGNGSTPYPSNGVSRFLATTNQTLIPSVDSSLSRSSMIASPVEDRGSSSNTITGDNVRRSTSVGNLIKNPVRVTQDSQETANIPSYTFALSGPGRFVAATQTKIDLWQSQAKVRLTGGPPAAMLGEAPIDLLNTDERRMTLWQNAEKELNAVRRFVNPILESAKRANLKDKPYRQTSVAHSVNGIGTAHNSHSTTPENRSHMLNGLARRNQEGSRPPSRTGTRAVRFEVGIGHETGRATESIESVDEILRRLWNSNEGTFVEG